MLPTFENLPIKNFPINAILSDYGSTTKFYIYLDEKYGTIETHDYGKYLMATDQLFSFHPFINVGKAAYNEKLLLIDVHIVQPLNSKYFNSLNYNAQTALNKLLTHLNNHLRSIKSLLIETYKEKTLLKYTKSRINSFINNFKQLLINYNNSVEHGYKIKLIKTLKIFKQLLLYLLHCDNDYTFDLGYFNYTLWKDTRSSKLILFPYDIVHFYTDCI